MNIMSFPCNNYFLKFHLKNLKSLCLVNKENTTIICIDDKAKTPVGQPGTPKVATSHIQKAWTAKDVTLESSDHNYHAVNQTPSVHLVFEIPENVTSSFYTGQIYVGIKDAVFKASDPFRYVVKLLSVYTQRKESTACLHTWFLFRDGGGDHNLTLLYVQCVLLALFKIGNFDILNVGSCAPNQSYINPAERCMSLLNIGLQGLSLQRTILF